MPNWVEVTARNGLEIGHVYRFHGRTHDIIAGGEIVEAIREDGDQTLYRVSMSARQIDDEDGLDRQFELMES